MYSANTIVNNPSGLHARPATIFVDTAKEFDSKIFLKNITKDIGPKNAKSIIMLLTLGITSGTEIEISAEGSDEQEAVAALINLVESGLGES